MPEHEDAALITVRQATRDWLRARAAGGQMSPHTQKAYQADIASVARLLAELLARDPEADAAEVVHVTDLTTRNLREVFADFGATRSLATLSRAQSTWRGLTGFCTQEGWLPGDPMAGVSRPRVPAGSPKPLKGGQATVTRLLEHLATEERSGRNPWRERDLAVVATLLTTGLRSAELRGLTRGDRYATGEDEYLRALGKGSKERAVPVLPPLAHALDAYEASRASRFPGWKPKFADPLFVNSRNALLTADALRWLVQTALRDAGLSGAPEREAFIHGFRHTAATEMSLNGASATEIQAMLGHASLNTSQRYIQAVAREVRAAAAAIPAYGTLRSLQQDDN